MRCQLVRVQCYLDNMDKVYNDFMDLIKGSLDIFREPLTKEYLISLGYVSLSNGKTFYQPYIKGRDSIVIKFDEVNDRLYRVYYGSEEVFIGLHDSKVWFDMFRKIVRL